MCLIMKKIDKKGPWFVVSEQMLKIYGERCAKADEKNFDGICDGCGFYKAPLPEAEPMCQFDVPTTVENYIRSFPLPPIRTPDPCEFCEEASIMACAMCIDRPWKRQTSKQYNEERDGALSEFEKRFDHRFKPHTLQGMACRSLI